MTSCQYRAMLRLPPAGAGQPTPVSLLLTVAGRDLYRVTCEVCGTGTAPMDWASVNRAGLAHRGAHARHNAGEPLVVARRSPALEAGA
jgi:hypothetical protein